MASVGQPRPGNSSDTLYSWEGKDKSGRLVQGEMRASV